MAAIRFIPAIVLILAFGAGARDAAADPRDCRGNGKFSTGCPKPAGNQTPTISGTPPPEVAAGSPYVFTPTASDPDGQSLTFSITNKPPWASFSGTSGRLSGTPGTAAVGEYIDIVIAVSDGRSTAALPAFSILVDAANRSPTISGTPPTHAREGQVYEFTPSASDPDGNALSFTIANRPAWATFNTQTGRLSGAPGTGSVGSYANVTIRVSDGSLVATLPAFSISVEQASLGSATLSWTAPTSNVDGTPLTDLAGYRVRYGTSPGSYPNQVQIANPGITSCVIENLPAGTYYFVATAYDSAGHESNFSGVVTKTIG
jgi:putative Ig domain-containing protein